jgi:hypothetical protein
MVSLESIGILMFCDVMSKQDWDILLSLLLSEKHELCGIQPSLETTKKH